MKIAGVQLDVRLGDVESNQSRIIEFTETAAAAGASLVVFPECALTGYCFESADEASQYAQTIPGPFTEHLAEACERLNIHVICGMVERDGDDLFNAAVCVGPSRQINSYRKVHLPYLGVDRFVSYGNRPFEVIQVGDLRVGMNICYDGSFPEAARSLTLLGADLIALPTNWPPGAECAAQSIASCRALENGVYYLAVNRVGTERNFPFIGQSQICEPGGRVLHRASSTEEELFYAEIDPAKARRKHVIRVPKEHEVHRLADRRPELYGPLAAPHSLKSPGRDET